jgi:hypothetical protein
MARSGPSRALIRAASASAAPEAAITLPKSAPSRKTGKRLTTKSPAARMKIWV